ncbi:MAG: hypothetical protein KF831_16140 [Acidobacteria bacterium]|nr:hypothetical protein [Acidobacteriota bacterium]
MRIRAIKKSAIQAAPRDTIRWIAGSEGVHIHFILSGFAESQNEKAAKAKKAAIMAIVSIIDRYCSEIPPNPRAKT